MVTLLSDMNCEGHAIAIFRVLQGEGWAELFDIRLANFRDVDLPKNADDERVWQLCQTQGYFLITGNRRTNDGNRSLELVMQRLATENTIPVLTIGRLERVLTERDYCDRCAESIVRILFEIERYRGTPRLYIPNSSGS